jgi:serine/threonine protein kinase
MGREEQSMEAVAVKEIDLQHEDIGLFENEVRALRALPEHRNLPKIVGSTKSKEKARIVLSYFPFPTLKEYLKEVGPQSSEDALYIFHQIVDAVNSMRKAGVMHRDIKSENILINPSSLQIKLIDFGLALVKKFVSETDKDFVYIGTPMYMPPDMLRKRPYCLVASDLWSAGIVFLEMLRGSHPYLNCKSEGELLTCQAAPLDLCDFDITCQVVLRGVLHPNEDHRSKINDLLKFLRSSAPLTSPSPKRSRWSVPLSKSLNTIQQ